MIVLLRDELIQLFLSNSSGFHFLFGRVDGLVGIDRLICIIRVAPLLPGVISVHLVRLACCVGFHGRAAGALAALDDSFSCFTFWTLLKDRDVRHALLPVLVDERSQNLKDIKYLVNI